MSEQKKTYEELEGYCLPVEKAPDDAEKCIDPTQTWFWTQPDNPKVVFEYRALTGAQSTRKLAGDGVNRCIVSVTNMLVPKIGYFPKWEITKGPAINWDNILRPDVATTLWTRIMLVSRLAEDEKRDSRSPSGQESTGKTTTATDAEITAPDGSVHDGRTKQTKAGNGSAPKRPKQAGAR